MDIYVPNETVCVKDSDEKILLEAPLLEIYFFLGSTTNQIASSSQESLTDIEKYKKVTEAINLEYKCKLSWPQVMQMTTDVNAKAQELKKNYNEKSKSQPPTK